MFAVTVEGGELGVNVLIVRQNRVEVEVGITPAPCCVWAAVKALPKAAVVCSGAPKFGGIVMGEAADVIAAVAANPRHHVVPGVKWQAQRLMVKLVGEGTEV